MTEDNKLMVMLKSDNVKERFIETVGRNGGSWITAIINAANSSPAIWECEPVSVITAGLNAAALRLSIDGSTGHACILPFKKRVKVGNKWTTEKRAVFVPMVRGLKQLAMRTDRYRYINSTAVYEGEEIREDRMSGIQYLEGRRTTDTIIGYYAAFQFYSGLTATEYMTVEECLEHGKKYSPSYDKQNKEFYKGSKWEDDFSVMAEKTVMRKLLMNKGYLDPGDRSIIESLDEDENEPISQEELGFTDPEDEPEIVEAEFSEADTMEELGFEIVGDSAGQPEPRQDPLWNEQQDPNEIYWDVEDSKGIAYREKKVIELQFSLTGLNKKIKTISPDDDAKVQERDQLCLKRDAVLYWLSVKVEPVKEYENG